MPDPTDPLREQLLDVMSFTECANQGTTPDALLDAYRNQVLTEADAIVRATPVPREAGPDWHWYAFALNRAADQLLATRTVQES